MATRRRTSAPRKTAKAVSAPVKKSPSVVTKVTKYSKPIEINKVTETQTPVKVRPEKPNLKWEDYRDDVKVRYQIHQFETQELWNDVVKDYNNAKPFVVKTINYVKDSYNRAFNETEEQKVN